MTKPEWTEDDDDGQIWGLARMMTLSDSPQATLTEKLPLPEICATLLTQYISEACNEKS